MAVTRKQIAAALLALLNSSNTFPTIGRRLVDPEQIGGGNFPALFLIKGTEKYHYDGEGETLPPVRVMDFEAYILTDYTATPSAVPADAIDDLLDAIDTALAPSMLDQMQNGNRQTLGNLVYNCTIDGDIKLAPGDSIGKGEVLIPIRVTLGRYVT
jgi:hypothetical protein